MSEDDELRPAPPREPVGEDRIREIQDHIQEIRRLNDFGWEGHNRHYALTVCCRMMEEMIEEIWVLVEEVTLRRRNSERFESQLNSALSKYGLQFRVLKTELGLPYSEIRPIQKEPV